MNNKGEFNLGVVKIILVTLLVMAIFVIVGMLVNLQLRTVTETIGSYNYYGNSETLTTVTETGENFAVVSDAYRNSLCTLTSVTNASGTSIAAANYTQTNCNLLFKAGGTAAFNNTNWVVVYTATYDTPYAYNIETNFSGGSQKFFSYVPTFMILLAVVTLILIIAIVVVVVTKFGGGSSSFNT